MHLGSLAVNLQLLQSNPSNSGIDRTAWVAWNRCAISRSIAFPLGTTFFPSLCSTLSAHIPPSTWGFVELLNLFNKWERLLGKSVGLFGQTNQFDVAVLVNCRRGNCGFYLPHLSFDCSLYLNDFPPTGNECCISMSL